MALIKHKTNKRKSASTAAKIPSIIVPSRNKNRPAQLAWQDFRNRTICVCLYPNIHCRISELPQTCDTILKIWRSILNEDIRYQHKLSNLPSFLGVRNVCVNFSKAQHVNTLDYLLDNYDNEDCYPYLRLFIDNIQVAAFIVQRWCVRTGCAPHSYSIIEHMGVELHSHEIECYKCNPFLIEHLCTNNTVHSIKFGAAATIYCEYVNPRTDLYNIPFVRCSSKFGKKLNTYAVRNAKRRITEKRDEQINKARNLLKRYTEAAAFLDARKESLHNNVAPVHRSYLGGFTYGRYKQHKQRYNTARFHAVGIYANWSAEDLDDQIAKQVLPNDALRVPQPDEFIEAHKELSRIAHAAVQNQKQLELDLECARDALKENANIYPTSSKRPRNNKQVKDAIFTSLSMAVGSPAAEKIKPTDVEASQVNAVADILAHFANIEIDYKTRQIKMKF